MKRSAVATLHRTARRGLTWRPKMLGRDEVAIDRLISPLRYDVVVRSQFFDFLEENDDLPADELLQAAREQDYRIWFETVALPRFRPWTLTDSTTLEEHFDERVLRSRTMLRSFDARGFDTRHPVTLRLVRGPAVTDSGVHVTPRLHVGDGGHRLALLLRSDGVLRPGQFKVDPRVQPAVLDNTAALARTLQLTEPVYARFVSAGFSDHRFASLAELHRDVAEHDPSRLVELEQVLQAHGRKAGLSV